MVTSISQKIPRRPTDVSACAVTAMIPTPQSIPAHQKSATVKITTATVKSTRGEKTFLAPSSSAYVLAQPPPAKTQTSFHAPNREATARASTSAMPNPKERSTRKLSFATAWTTTATASWTKAAVAQIFHSQAATPAATQDVTACKDKPSPAVPKQVHAAAESVSATKATSQAQASPA